MTRGLRANFGVGEAVGDSTGAAAQRPVPADFDCANNGSSRSVGRNHAGDVANFSVGRFSDAIRRVRNYFPTRNEQTVARNKESVAGPQELAFRVENGEFNNRRCCLLCDFLKFWRRCLRRWCCCNLSCGNGRTRCDIWSGRCSGPCWCRSWRRRQRGALWRRISSTPRISQNNKKNESTNESERRLSHLRLFFMNKSVTAASLVFLSGRG